MSATAGGHDWRRTLALVSVASLWLVAPAAAQDAGPEPVFTPTQASIQLDEAVDALTANDPAVADPTDELRDLALALPYLDGRERRQARAILARPPSHNGAGLGDAGWVEDFDPAEWSDAATTSRDAMISPGGEFKVHWVTVSSDAPDLADNSPANGIPDYVDLVATRADDSQMVENGTLGWPAAKSDGARGGGDGLTDIYLADICGPGACLFGYAAADDFSGECGLPPFKCFAYLVLDDDYAEFTEYPEPDIPLQVTAAHEYNHILQFAIDSEQDGWMFEATAIWVEEQVFPDGRRLALLRGPLGRASRGCRSPSSAPAAASASTAPPSGTTGSTLGAGYGPDVDPRRVAAARASRTRRTSASAPTTSGSRPNGGTGLRAGVRALHGGDR